MLAKKESLTLAGGAGAGAGAGVPAGSGATGALNIFVSLLNMLVSDSHYSPVPIWSYRLHLSLQQGINAASPINSSVGDGHPDLRVANHISAFSMLGSFNQSAGCI